MSIFGMVYISLEVYNQTNKANNFCRRDRKEKSQSKKFFLRVKVLTIFKNAEQIKKLQTQGL